MSKEKFITTTLPYINSNAHIGHVLELVQADVLTRFFETLINKKNVDIDTLVLNSDFGNEVSGYCRKIDSEFEKYNIQKAYDYVHQLVNRTNQYLNDNEPWKLEDNEAGLILQDCYISLEYLATYYSFILPNRPDIEDVIVECDNKTILFERL